MSHTFKKTSLRRGFTLIELLVVIAIIGLLSTVIAAPITQARKKGRDGKKVADIHQIQGALQQYADDHIGSYPVSLDGLVPTYLANLPPAAATSSLAKDKYVYSAYALIPANGGQVVGFHIGSKLEAPALALGDDRDCHGIGSIVPADAFCQDITAGPNAALTDFAITAGNFTGTAGHVSFPNDLNSLGAAGTAYQDGDFQGGADTASSSCTALFKATLAAQDACIYDITN